MLQSIGEKNMSAENQIVQQFFQLPEKALALFPRVLIVEDEASIRKIIRRTLKMAGYQNDTAACAEEARLLCQKTEYGLVLCDIGLPGESGLSFIQWLAEACPETLSIMVTGCNDMEVAEHALSHGAYSYVVKPFSNRDLLISVAGALNERQRQLQVQHKTSELQKEISVQAMELAASNARLKQTMHGVIKAMAAALESRDPYTVGHQERVAKLSIAIGKRLGLNDDRIQALHIAAMVHDIGKISIPAEILNKPGKLSQIEFELIKTHAETGFKILKEIDFPWPVADIVHQHHEHVDGSGYPRKLTGTELMLEAKILTVADVVEAMASHRPYRPALDIQLALTEITDNRNRYYAPDAVNACLAVFENHEYRYLAG